MQEAQEGEAGNEARIGPGTAARILSLLQELTAETDKYVDTLARRHAIHRTDLEALGVVARSAVMGEPVTAGRLGEELSLSSPATTALIDRLDRAGHLKRRRDTADRRQVYLEMTDHARETGHRLFAPLARHISGALSSMPERDALIVAGFLRLVIDATREAKTEAAGFVPDHRDAGPQ